MGRAVAGEYSAGTWKRRRLRERRRGSEGRECPSDGKASRKGARRETGVFRPAAIAEVPSGARCGGRSAPEYGEHPGVQISATRGYPATCWGAGAARDEGEACSKRGARAESDVEQGEGRQNAPEYRCLPPVGAPQPTEVRVPAASVRQIAESAWMHER